MGWLAGFLEGEGSFLWYSTKSRAAKRGERPNERILYPRVQFITTDCDVAMRAAALMGGNTVSHRPHPVPRHKDQYRHKLSGQRALDLMRLLLPHTGERRSADIQSILSNTDPGRTSRKERG